MVVLLFQIRSLIRLIQEEVRPLLNSANETVGTVRGTATFVSDHMVTPGLKVLSFFSGARRTLEVLARMEDREE
jgi:K+ transporter